MNIFDLFFLFLVLATFSTLIADVALLFLGRFKTVLKLLLYYGVGLLLYFFALIAVSVTSEQREIAMKEDRCFDDWCIAVEDVSFAQQLGHEQYQAQAKGLFYIVKLRLSNHARGRDQRASSAAVHLFDRYGQNYDVSLTGQAAFEAEYGKTSTLTSTIPLGQSITVVQVFDVPQNADNIFLTVEHPVGWFPGLLIMGHESSLFHKPTIVRLLSRER
ncbi:MAG: DUF4352 domain-containing protein [Acidobacteria bacterium]|nr:DUF4352 domain-containing protein [Acidobacteriota bacterium]